MSLIRKHGAVLQAWACLDLVFFWGGGLCKNRWLQVGREDLVEASLSASAQISRWNQQLAAAAAAAARAISVNTDHHVLRHPTSSSSTSSSLLLRHLHPSTDVIDDVVHDVMH